jgi:hypothetical protein
VTWSGDRWWQLGVEIALRRVKLRLGEEDAPCEVGTSEVGAPEVSPGKVGHPQVRVPHIGTDETRASHVGTSEVGTPEIFPDEVGATEVGSLAPGACPHQFTHPAQQAVDPSPVRCHVHLHKRTGTVAGEAFCLLERETELTMQRAGRSQRQCLSQVPQQFMELPHDREHLEHLLGDSRRLAPVLPAEGGLCDLLPRAEAVVNGTPPEPLWPEAIVNGTAEVLSQVRAGPPGVLVDGEVRRDREGRHDTAQPEAALTVSTQTQTMVAGHGCCGLARMGQGGLQQAR